MIRTTYTMLNEDVQKLNIIKETQGVNSRSEMLRRLIDREYEKVMRDADSLKS